MRCLVLAARPYDFKDDDGARVEGVTLHYCTSAPEEGARSVGHVPLNISAPVKFFHLLESVPGHYEIEFGQRPGRGGRPAPTVVGMQFLDEANLGFTPNGVAH